MLSTEWVGSKRALSGIVLRTREINCSRRSHRWLSPADGGLGY